MKETSMSNLSRKQFEAAKDIETEQRRRQLRRGLGSGFVGIGTMYANYPAMYGTMGTGGDMTAMHEAGETPMQETAEHDAGTDAGETNVGASDATGMGEGGTAASATGAAGGSLG
jgi:hypothetical protein